MPSDSFSRMDSRNSESESTNGANESLLGTSPGAASTSSRERYDSDSSDRQARFVLPGTACSPPKVLTMEEVQNAIKNVEDMTLAHEIAINPDFRLEPYAPPENSLEKRIKTIMHDAFWDLLKEQINSSPPSYDQAIALLADIREGFTHIISKNNQKALDRIFEVLDPQVIRQQAEQGVLDFKSYANFIIQLMAKSCAPIRDEQVAKLSEIDDVVITFRSILEVMDLMKLDMANCLLEAARREVITQSVEYEKHKFNEYLKYYTNGFPATENWLKRNQCGDLNQKNAKAITIVNAYLEFFNWNFDNEYPEIVAMDKDRIIALVQRAHRVCILTSIIAIASSLPIIGQNAENKRSLLQQIEILLQNFTDDKDLPELIENVWLQVKSVIVKLMEKNDQKLTEETENALKQQILAVTDKESAVRQLMWKRLLAYVRLVKTNKVLPPVPPGFNDLSDELQSLSNTFKRLTVYNYSVFGEHLEKLLECIANPNYKEIEKSEENKCSDESTTKKDADAGPSQQKDVASQQ